MVKQYAIIGLGRFGGSICRKLSEQGQAVLAIDRNEDRVREYTKIATHAVIADTTDESVLEDLGIRNFDHAIVAIGDDLQSSILTTLILKEIGIKKATAKAMNDYHGKVLNKIGADYVIHPERDSGERVAMHIMSSNILDYLELSNKYGIVEIVVGNKMKGKTLYELDIRAKFGINILAVKTGKSEFNISPKADEQFPQGDTLVIMGAEKDIQHFRKKMLESE